MSATFDTRSKQILLVRPPSAMGRAGAHALQHPIGLCWLAASLGAAGFSAEIADYEVEKYSETEFENRVRGARPAAVAITAMTPGISTAGRMAAAAKRALPGVTVIVGGAHAAMFPARTLEEYAAFDAASTGDGEDKIVRLARAAADGGLNAAEIAGCAIRRGDGVADFSSALVEPLELDSIPLPARELLKKELYRGASTPGFPSSVYNPTVVFTSRGCPGKCIFCCSDKVFGRAVRFRSIDNVMGEIAECVYRHGFNHFTIDDDTFTLKRGRVEEFCEKMGPLPATWDCDTRVDRVDEELVRMMAESGCKKIAFGVETGSPEIMKKIQKGITIEQVRAAFSFTKKAGVMSCAFLMVGNHPDETLEDIEMTRRLVREVSPDLISVMVATPYPGTGLYDAMRAESLIGDVPWDAYAQSFTSEVFSRTKTLTAEDLKRGQSRLLRGFYLRPSYILKRLAALRSPGELKYWASAGVSFLRHTFGGAKRKQA